MSSKRRGGSTHSIFACSCNQQISSITFNVFIAAKQNANFVWLDLSTAQNQILNIMESLIFAAGLALGKEKVAAKRRMLVKQSLTRLLAHSSPIWAQLFLAKDDLDWFCKLSVYIYAVHDCLRVFNYANTWRFLILFALPSTRCS